MHSKSKKFKRQAKSRAQRRCRKLVKSRRQGKGTAHGPRLTRNQHEVAKRLLAGDSSEESAWAERDFSRSAARDASVIMPCPQCFLVKPATNSTSFPLRMASAETLPGST